MWKFLGKIALGMALVAVALAWFGLRFQEPLKSWTQGSWLSPAGQALAWAALAGGAWLIANSSLRRFRGEPDDHRSQGASDS